MKKGPARTAFIDAGEEDWQGLQYRAARWPAMPL